MLKLKLGPQVIVGTTIKIFNNKLGKVRLNHIRFCIIWIVVLKTVPILMYWIGNGFSHNLCLSANVSFTLSFFKPLHNIKKQY